jgi:hypothetical protein
MTTFEDRKDVQTMHSWDASQISGHHILGDRIPGPRTAFPRAATHGGLSVRAPVISLI